ncbi:ABC exporter membrane fusion protein [Leptolyngbya ohadii]|uniref:ABC exporter membrane fusion protein n=1 Tax=Leptolyngbya ohadii TaxID=1962290 RepID=UPI000B59F1B1|nr:ABC exporter membrane fusion protein [Leptolyngbya ohadii]
MSLNLSSKPPYRLLGLILAATALTGGIGFYTISQFSSTPATVESEPPRIQKVTALGRLEPEGEVIQIAAPLSLDGDRVSQLRVKEGMWVEAGQPIAVLDSYQSLREALQQAEQEVVVAQSRVDQVRAGAKSGEIAAQTAAIVRLQAELAGQKATQSAAIARRQAELRTARAEFDRFEQLYREGAIPASTRDSKQLALDTAQTQLQEAIADRQRTLSTLEAEIQSARATLNQIAEVRPVDIQAATAELAAAKSAAQRARTALEQSMIRAPIAGRILKIHTQPGEQISESGIAEIARTDQMQVVAEVYQTDVGKVQAGQQAVITSPALAEPLRGTVAQIGYQVNRQNVFSDQPGENLDQRVVEVKIRLGSADSQKVAGLTNLQVQVALEME